MYWGLHRICKDLFEFQVWGVVYPKASFSELVLGYVAPQAQNLKTPDVLPQPEEPYTPKRNPTSHPAVVAPQSRDEALPFQKFEPALNSSCGTKTPAVSGFLKMVSLYKC